MKSFPIHINLDNKVIVITGGYGHLGVAICESLSFHGARVYVIGRSDAKFKEAFGLCDDSIKVRIAFIRGDIADENQVQSCLKEIFDRTGKIDVLINNAFFLKGQSPTEMTVEDFSFGLDGVLTSVYTMIKNTLSYLNNGAKIINVASMYGVVSPDFGLYGQYPEFLNPPHYGAAKSGVIQLTKYYASFLGSKGINVNSVTPGPFPSIKVQEKKNFINELSRRTVLNRIGLPEEAAGVFVFLASDAASYITGQNFVVDGGWTTR